MLFEIPVKVMSAKEQMSILLAQDGRFTYTTRQLNVHGYKCCSFFEFRNRRGKHNSEFDVFFVPLKNT
jgi:hypothetical protein